MVLFGGPLAVDEWPAEDQPGQEAATLSVPGPELGPCTAWIDGDDVAVCCDATSNPASYEDVALEASMLMYELSGRIFSGVCERTVRPCSRVCGCDWGIRRWWADGPSWSGWCDERGNCGCGCCALSIIKLAGYPVRAISEVKIDGDVIDPSEYRLDYWRELVRLDDPGPPLEKRRWPACQNLALEDSEENTFSVTYSWGVDPPPSGIRAASALACQLYSSCAGESCSLPAGATRVTRQGVEFDRSLLLNFLSMQTGIPEIDVFLAAYSRGLRRRSAVWSPDVRPFPRKNGA